MLQSDIEQAEERWINYDEEYTEVNAEVSDMIFDSLIMEFVKEALIK